MTAKMDRAAAIRRCPVMSFLGQTSANTRNRSICWITYTNRAHPRDHRNNLDRSPTVYRVIERCWSALLPIRSKTKIHRFAGQEPASVFIEPEGLIRIELYPTAFPTSLPFVVAITDVQVRSEGMAKRPYPAARLIAIEYDYFNPQDLKYFTGNKVIAGCSSAGQIQCTTGYEEAACPRLVGRMNAARRSQDSESLAAAADEAYIGVLRG